MKKLIKASYIIRIVFFIVHFYFVFMMLDSILDTKYAGPIFLTLYLFYILYTLFELMSKKKKYQIDIVYNIMQTGLCIYLIVLSLRINIYGIYVGTNTNIYFLTNYTILSILLIFVVSYSFFEFRKINKELH